MSRTEIWGVRLLALTVLLALATATPACRRPSTPTAPAAAASRPSSQAAPAVTAVPSPTQAAPTVTSALSPTEAAPAVAAVPSSSRPAAAPPTRTEPRPTTAPAPLAVAATPAPRAEVPADHTKDRKGARHMKGSHEAMVNCTPCHGADLKGDPPRPSCYECHGKEWH